MVALKSRRYRAVIRSQKDKDPIFLKNNPKLRSQIISQIMEKKI